MAHAQSGQGGQPDPAGPVRVLSQRPYRGIFGGGLSETSQLLTLGLNMGGGYDSSVLVDNGTNADGTTPPETPPNTTSLSRQGGGFGQASANLNYALSRKAFGLSADGGVSASYYPVLVNDPIVHNYFANVSSQWRLATRASLAGGYSINYGPYQYLSSLPGAADPRLGPSNPFGNTIGAQAESYRNESVSASLSYSLTRRLGLSTGIQGTRVVTPDTDRQASTRAANARMHVGLTRNFSAYVGYGFQVGRYGDDSPDYRTHNVDFGLDFAKALSLTRKTTATFGVGSRGVTDGTTSTYAFTGNVNLHRELGRTWSASAGYSRDARFDQAFRQPVFSDSVMSNVGGFLSRRVRADAGVSYSFGNIGFGNDDNGYRTVYSSAGLGIAITRFLNSGLRYSYSRYLFDGGVDVPRDLLLLTGRHGVNAYLSAWLPLFSRTR
jgi:hypothetical protein